jgi:hypothetical protein
MRRALLWTGLFSLLGLKVGCASSEHEMRQAQEHQYKADQAAARGDYAKAASEQQKANDKREKAYRTRYYEERNVPPPEPYGY